MKPGRRTQNQIDVTDPVTDRQRVLAPNRQTRPDFTGQTSGAVPAGFESLALRTGGSNDLAALRSSRIGGPFLRLHGPWPVAIIRRFGSKEKDLQALHELEHVLHPSPAA